MFPDRFSAEPGRSRVAGRGALLRSLRGLVRRVERFGVHRARSVEERRWAARLADRLDDALQDALGCFGAHRRTVTCRVVRSPTLSLNSLRSCGVRRCWRICSVTLRCAGRRKTDVDDHADHGHLRAQEQRPDQAGADPHDRGTTRTSSRAPRKRLDGLARRGDRTSEETRTAARLRGRLDLRSASRSGLAARRLRGAGAAVPSRQH
jgi:hypothetical protein